MPGIHRAGVLAFASITAFAGLAAAQTTATDRGASATVSGVVYDSIAQAPLAGATVELVPAGNVAGLARTAISDSLGRFTVLHVPDGTYMLGFFHPLLDSLGVEPPLRQVVIDHQRAAHADLAIPSPVRLRAAICGPRSAADTGNAVVVGSVRSAQDGAPLSGVRVTGEWVELSFAKTGITRRLQHLAATTGENGWFALCNVPSGGTIFLVASRGADSTDLLEAQVPAGGFLRRELYLGPARAMVTADTSRAKDSLAAPPRPVHVGDVVLTGIVVATLDGRPLPGAQVSIAGGRPTRTDEQGAFRLVDAPLGTRTLEVRAFGYYPERRSVNVVANPAPLRVALSTLTAVLDTVRISATRRYNRDRNGFEQRRRSGMGRFLGEAELARQPFLTTSDLIGNQPNMRHDRSAFDEMSLVMRNTFDDWCAPSYYINGMYMRALSADELDTMLRPRDIASIEIYTESNAPPQFQPGMSGCGSVVIWTKPTK